MDEQARARRYWRWLGRSVLAAVAVWAVISAVNARYVLALNETESLPQRVFLVQKGAAVQRGAYCAFRERHARHYPAGTIFVKRIVGGPGDRVSSRRLADGRTLFLVNGKPVGVALPVNRFGDAMQPGPTGVIPAGHWFVWTPHPRSYDSRYADIGWVSQKEIVGRALPLI